MTAPMSIDPASLVRPRRVITGMSAILLPMKAGLTVDWEGFAAHVARTSAAGITPAINMDTGSVQLIDDALQALGDFAFRPPVPAYKHTMAQALHLQGLIATDEPHPKSPRRPATDREIVRTILDRIDAALHAT